MPENLDKVSQNSFADFLEAAVQVMFDRLDSREKAEPPSTGFKCLDDILGMFRPGDFIVCAGAVGVGKSAFILNIVSKMMGRLCSKQHTSAKEQPRVVVFSLEQDGGRIAERLLSQQTKVSLSRLLNGRTDSVEAHAVLETSELIKSWPLLIDDAYLLDVQAVRERLLKYVSDGPIELAVIDHLQLLSRNHEQSIDDVAAELKRVAREVRVPLLVISGISRGSERREDRRPRLNELPGNGNVEGQADIVLFVHRNDLYEPDDRPGEVDVIIAKNRSGSPATAEFVWLKHAMLFGEKAPLEDDKF